MQETWERARGRSGSFVPDRGAATVEYVGVVVAIVVVVLGIVVAGPRIGEQLACEIRRSIEGSGECGGSIEPTYYDASQGRDGTDGDDGSDGVSGRPQDGDDGEGDEAQDGDAQDGDGVAYRNASDTDVEVDQDAVDQALEEFRDALDGGFLGVRSGDLDDAHEALQGLTGPELDAFVSALSDEEVEHWVDQMEDWWIWGGWNREERRELWEALARTASKQTLDRLNGFTDELQPRFDEVGGDDARDDPESVANTAEYGEIVPMTGWCGISPLDVRQGAIGDCWYIASMMAVAQADPTVIGNAIEANANGSYTVTLYDDGEPVRVTVTPDMVLNDGNPAFVRNTPVNGTYEMWPMVLEKALALHWGDYREIEGDSPGLGLSIVTGQPSERRSPGDAGGAESLATYLDDGGAITVATFPENDDNPPLYHVSPADGGLASNHAYYVSAVDVEEGTVTLTNPWGAGWPTVTMSYSELETNVGSVYVNEVSP